jgi:hypothetical protein
MAEYLPQKSGTSWHFLKWNIKDNSEGGIQMDIKVAIGLGLVALGSFIPGVASRGPWATLVGDACSMLTQSEVSAGLGVQVGAGNGSMPKICQWREQAKPGADILIADLNGPDITLFNNVKSMASSTGAALRPASGLGDEAFFYYKQAGRMVSEILWFRKGDLAYNVRVWGHKKISDAEREAKEKAIASTVLHKL